MWFQRLKSIVSLCVKRSLKLPLHSSHGTRAVCMSPQSSIRFTSAGDAKWGKRLMWLCSSCSRQNGRRRRRGGSQMTDERRERGWSSGETDWSGWGLDRLPGCHEMPSEEVVTHHLDELWHLRPGGTQRKIKKRRIRKKLHTLHTRTHNIHIEKNVDFNTKAFMVAILKIWSLHLMNCQVVHLLRTWLCSIKLKASSRFILWWQGIK